MISKTKSTTTISKRKLLFELAYLNLSTDISSSEIVWDRFKKTVYVSALK